MKSSALVCAALFASSSFALPEAQMKRVIRSNGDQELKLASLPKEIRERIAWLRPGVTRSQLEQYFTQNGGLSVPFHQRYYLRDFVVSGKVVMVEIAYQPADIPKNVYADRSRALRWARGRNYGDNKADIIQEVSSPFYASVASD